jgi:hypothetical protein
MRAKYMRERFFNQSASKIKWGREGEEDGEKEKKIVGASFSVPALGILDGTAVESKGTRCPSIG